MSPMQYCMIGLLSTSSFAKEDAVVIDAAGRPLSPHDIPSKQHLPTVDIRAQELPMQPLRLLATLAFDDDSMAAPDAGALARRGSIAPPVGGAAVPVGAAPVVPAYVPPAQVYEDDEDEVEEVMKPQRQIVQAGAASGPSTVCILCTAMVILTVAAAATFYAIDMAKAYTETTTVSSTKATPPPVVFHYNVTAKQGAGLDFEEGRDATTDDGEVDEIQASNTRSV
ncbi:uncharacterized protein LOC142578401 [Dermacentor variabilis]|uniref:uncharacterized protein LOC142578401 n=1 Tax=Dermacentor variabilis TaxID=34621 RepID=UPI003F5BC204